MKRIFLFDLDGTITDPKIGITTCVQYSLKFFGIKEENLDKLECFIGPPLHKSYQEYYGLSEEQSIIAVEKYRERYRDIGIFECTMYDGISEVLSNIKAQGGKIGLATSKPEEFAKRLLDHYDISRYFDCITGSMMDGRRTEKCQVIEEVFKRMGVVDNKEEVIMIGDRLHDVIGAKTMGIETIGVKYGYSVGDELNEAGAEYVVETVEELRKLTNQLICCQ